MQTFQDFTNFVGFLNILPTRIFEVTCYTKKRKFEVYAYVAIISCNCLRFYHFFMAISSRGVKRTRQNQPDPTQLLGWIDF